MREGRRGARAAPLLLLLTALGAAGLRDVQVKVPEAAAVGDTVSLNCSYDLEKDALYSVKWYKGRQEFFRYVPKELPHIKVFPLPGVDVDVGESGPKAVVLRSVSPALSGRYRCEVSADSPSFHTVMKTSYMHIVELPESAPVITAEKMRVSVGDTLRVRCSAPPAHPPANLTWLLNNIPVKGTAMDLDPPAHQKPTKRPEMGTEHTFLSANRNWTRVFDQINSGNEPEIENTGYVLRGQRDTDKIEDIQMNLETYTRKISHSEEKIHAIDSIENDGIKKLEGVVNIVSNPEPEPAVKRRSGSSLVLAIRQDSFQQGRLTLTCRATVFSLYSAQAQLVLEGERPQIASVLGTRESSSGTDTLTTKIVYLSLFLPYFLQR